MTTNDATDRVLKYHPWLVKTAGQLADKYSAERDDCYQMLALKLCEGHTLDIAYRRVAEALGKELERRCQTIQLEHQPVDTGADYTISVEVMDVLQECLTDIQLNDLVRWLYGVTQNQIARDRGVGQPIVSRSINAGLKKAKKIFVIRHIFQAKNCNKR
jgi:hypothetical protein